MATVAESDLAPQLDSLADAVIAAYENNDAESYRRLFVPGAAVWLSYLNGEMSAEQNANLLSEIFTTFVAEFHYENMRRQRTATGYVQQCDLTIVAKNGAIFTTPMCTVARVSDDGLIERLNEYMDSKIMTFGQEQAQVQTID